MKSLSLMMHVKCMSSAAKEILEEMVTIEEKRLVGGVVTRNEMFLNKSNTTKAVKAVNMSL